MATAATIAVLNQHLASIVTLPQTAAAPSNAPLPGADPQPLAPRAAPPALAKNAPKLTNLVQTSIPVLAFHNPTPDDARYLYPDISSQSSSSPYQLGFRRNFIAKQGASRVPYARHVPRLKSSAVAMFSSHGLDCIYAAPRTLLTLCPIWHL